MCVWGAVIVMVVVMVIMVSCDGGSMYMCVGYRVGMTTYMPSSSFGTEIK